MTATSRQYPVRFSVCGEADPLLPARIFGLTSVSGRIPPWFVARLDGDNRLYIEFDHCCVDDHAAVQLLGRLHNIPSVLSASAVLDGRPVSGLPLTHAEAEPPGVLPAQPDTK